MTNLIKAFRIFRTMELEEQKDLFIGTIGRLSASLGINQKVGQLYTLLFLSDTPLSLDEMAERLNVSKGNVSLNIRDLERWEAVKKVWTKGSRKDYYTAELDIVKIILNRLNVGLKQRINQVSEAVRESEALLSSVSLDKEEKIDLFKERLDRVKGVCILAEGLLKHMKEEKYVKD